MRGLAQGQLAGGVTAWAWLSPRPLLVALPCTAFCWEEVGSAPFEDIWVLRPLGPSDSSAPRPAVPVGSPVSSCTLWVY